MVTASLSARVLVAVLTLENARLRDELEQVEEWKTEFLNTMSHELRTPLSAIIGYCELLLAGTFGELQPEQAEALRRIECNSAELNGVVNATMALGSGRAPDILPTLECRETAQKSPGGALIRLAVECDRSGVVPGPSAAEPPGRRLSKVPSRALCCPTLSKG